jgi:hypothetical protein
MRASPSTESLSQGLELGQGATHPVGDRPSLAPQPVVLDGVPQVREERAHRREDLLAFEEPYALLLEEGSEEADEGNGRARALYKSEGVTEFARVLRYRRGEVGSPVHASARARADRGEVSVPPGR